MSLLFQLTQQTLHIVYKYIKSLYIVVFLSFLFYDREESNKGVTQNDGN